MANHHPQAQSPGGFYHGPPPGHHPNGVVQMAAHQKITPAHLAALNEVVWIGIGSTSEAMGDLDEALRAYERALQHNGTSIKAMNAISTVLRTKENFPKAVEYLQAILKIENSNGEVWGSLGHCYLMMEDLQQAYTSYQQALYHLPNPQEPKLWYGIGILYDRYGSLEHAEEAFSQVMRMEPTFEKANEIYFRLGIIYKQQQKYQQSLECFRYIVQIPPRPLTEEDIWFQIGHVHEQQKDYDSAKAAYRKVLDRDPNHAKVLQQLGWLHHQQSQSYDSQDQAITYLEKSVRSDNSDAQSWYLLGRCYMSQQKYSKAYEAYQQAVYRDGRNPTFWCSIGVLYYQINQYRDALDAYSRAIRLNPYISEVWYDLGTLYESCNNQTNDALDAYQRAADLDPQNSHIRARLNLLKNNGQSTGMPNQHPAPVPQDIHPQNYQAAGVGAPPGPQWGASAPSTIHQAPNAPAGAPSQDFNRHLAEIRQPQPPPQPPNPYDPRDPRHPPPPHRQPSPRQEQMRQYPEHHRHTPVRRQSPPPLNHPNGPPAAYGTPQSMPQPPPAQMHQQPPNRITNPNYAAPPPAASLNPPPPQPHPPQQGPIVPYGRGNSPPPEIRPITEERPPTPGHGYQPHHYQHHANPSAPAGIAQGAPPPTAALDLAEAAARDRDDRGPPPGGIPGSTPYKRNYDEEDERDRKMMHKYPANGDTRGMREDMHHRRGSPGDRRASPAGYGRGPPSQTLSPRSRPLPPQSPTARSHMSGHRYSDSSDAKRDRDREREAYERAMEMDRKPPMDQPRRMDDPYMPSEAAHHPVPPMQMPGPPPPHPAIHRMQQGPPPPQDMRGPPRPPSSGPQNLAHPPMIHPGGPGGRDSQAPPTPTGPSHQQQGGPPPPPPQPSSLPPPPHHQQQQQQQQQQPPLHHSPPVDRKDVEMKYEHAPSAMSSNTTGHTSPSTNSIPGGAPTTQGSSRPGSVMDNHRPGGGPSLLPPPPAPPTSSAPRDREREEERYEAPVRKMEIDDDYDNDVEEDRKSRGGGGGGGGNGLGGEVSPKSGGPVGGVQQPVAVNGGGAGEGGN